MGNGKKILRGVSSLCACLCALFIGAELIAGSEDYKPMVNKFLGGVAVQGGSKDSFAFDTDYATTTEMLTERRKIAEQLGEEGCVLLENDGALPLRKRADDDAEMKITVLGSRAYTYKADGTTLRDYINPSNKLFFYGGATGSRVYDQTVTTLDEEGNAKTTGVPITLERALADQNIKINPALIHYYNDRDFPALVDGGEAAGQSGGAYCVNEPSVAKSDCGETDEYDDAVLVVIGRFSGEGRDYLPGERGVKDTEKDGGQKSALHLSDHERNLISVAYEICPEKVVVLVNSAVPMEINDLKEGELADKVNSVLWIGLPGAYSLTGVARVLSGNAVDEGKTDGAYRQVSPSGHLPDTYAVEASRSPAAQNFGTGVQSNTDTGVHDFLWSNAHATGNDNSDDSHYVVLAEDLYTGYYYYETRYNDCITGDGDPNASVIGANDAVVGATQWKYEDEVAYSFGYGGSYTSFRRTISSDPADFVYDSDNKTVSLKVNVRNMGDYPAKDVVQLYVQLPYTSYDKAHGVEKSAIQLIAFGKTETLAPDQEQTVEITARMKYFASYDKTANDGRGGYIMAEGKYYFAVGNGAHEALNNVLAVRGFDNLYSDKGVPVDTDSVYTWTLGSSTDKFSFMQKDGAGVDFTFFEKNATGNYTVQNQLADADYNYFEDRSETVVYLTRQNYAGTFPKAYANLKLPQTDLAKKQINDNVYAFKSGSVDVEFDVDHTEQDELPNKQVAEFKLAAFDDENWEYLIQQISFTDAHTFSPYGGTYCIGLSSVSAPEVYQIDGPNGNLTRPYSENGFKSGYLAITADDPNRNYSAADMPCEPMIAATFNAELIYREGRIFGEDNIWSRNPIMWAPGMNLHRTPFCSRNHEYYSEDAILTNVLGAAFVQGGLEKGSILAAKHFAFNTQESFREGLVQFMEEQSAREKELRAFQGLCEDVEYINAKGNSVSALGLMTSFSRIGLCGVNGHGGLMKNILRNEWGFRGLSSTDMVTGSYYFNPQDSVINNVVFMATSNGKKFLTEWKDYGNKSKVQKDPDMMRALYDNMHYYLYSIANSSALNGINPGDKVESKMSYWEYILIGLGGTTGLGALLSLAFVVVRDVKERKSDTREGKEE